jgi:hypothetical protein
MTRFVEQAIARAGLSSVIPSRARGDVDAVKALVASLVEIDLLALGAVADAVRVAEAGDAVRVHPTASSDVRWIVDAGSELALLRQVAIARITGPIACRIGVDWGRHGLELAQVALGFGATDLTGPITRKSGVLISEDELKKVKGQGMVAATALKRREIAALIRNAARFCEFTDEALVGDNGGAAEGGPRDGTLVGDSSGPVEGGTRDETGAIASSPSAEVEAIHA